MADYNDNGYLLNAYNIKDIILVTLCALVSYRAVGTVPSLRLRKLIQSGEITHSFSLTRGRGNQNSDFEIQCYTASGMKDLWFLSDLKVGLYFLLCIDNSDLFL